MEFLTKYLASQNQFGVKNTIYSFTQSRLQIITFEFSIMTRFSNKTYFSLQVVLLLKTARHCFIHTVLYLLLSALLCWVFPYFLNRWFSWLFKMRKNCLRIYWTVTVVCLMFQACIFMLFLSIDCVAFQRTRFRNCVFYKWIVTVLNFHENLICTFALRIGESFYNEKILFIIAHYAFETTSNFDLRYHCMLIAACLLNLKTIHAERSHVNQTCNKFYFYFVVI